MKLPIFRLGYYHNPWALDLVPPTISLNRRFKWSVQFGDRNAIIEDRHHISRYKGYGRWKTVQSASHVVMVEAWAQIRDGGQCVILRAGNLHRRLDSGHDHQWQWDSLGLTLVRLSDQEDYHPCAEMLLSPNFGGQYNGTATVDLIKRNIERVAIRRAEVLEGARSLVAEDVDGVWVSLRDSLEAGNCLEGSRQWAVKRRINIHHHYPAEKLMEFAGSEPRLIAAIKVAIKRNKMEMESGMCELSRHAT